jgi:uncharacterized protein YuzE
MLSTVQIDRENDLAYILLRPDLQNRRGVVSRSVRVAEDFVVDLDHDGQIVGIEILHASSRLNLKQAGEAPYDVVAGVAEAAEMSESRSPISFGIMRTRQIFRRRLPRLPAAGCGYDPISKNILNKGGSPAASEFRPSRRRKCRCQQVPRSGRC